MSLLETQVGQIQVSGRKLSRSFISLQSEKIPETSAEIYAVVEITPLKKSEYPDAEKVSNIIATELKKHFGRTSPNSFENAVAQINHELSRLAGAGKTSWVGKLDAVMAARQNEHLFIATTGKVQAYLYRDKQFSNISDSAAKQNPLKVFENFAIGKVKKRDTLILSSAQLFNYITMERLHAELVGKPITSACETIARILTDASDDSISLGTFIIEFDQAEVPIAPKPNQEEPQETYASQEPIKAQVASYASRLLAKAKDLDWKRLDDVAATLGSLVPKSISASKLTSMDRIKSLPKTKRFFLISATIFMILLITNVAISVNSAEKNKAREQMSARLELIQNKINDANSAYIYGDRSEASRLLNEAQTELDALPETGILKEERESIASELKTMIEKVD